MTVAHTVLWQQSGLAYRHRIGAGLLVCVLFVAAVFAVRFAASNLLVEGVDAAQGAAYRRQSQLTEPISQADQLHWLNDLATAQRLAASDAAPHDLARRVHLTPVQAGDQTFTSPSFARAALQAALVRRPTSGYGWAHLAAVEYGLMPAGKLTDEFLQAHANAAQFGPWEREVLAVVVDLGLATWNETTAGSKAVTEGAIARLGLRHPDDVLAFAVRRGGLAQICDKPRWQEKPQCQGFS